MLKIWADAFLRAAGEERRDPAGREIDRAASYERRVHAPKRVDHGRSGRS